MNESHAIGLVSVVGRGDELHVILVLEGDALEDLQRKQRKLEVVTERGASKAISYRSMNH
jgi:hypothetical protein